MHEEIKLASIKHAIQQDLFQYCATGIAPTGIAPPRVHSQHIWCLICVTVSVLPETRFWEIYLVLKKKMLMVEFYPEGINLLDR